MKHEWITPGIPDSEFIRGSVPMTKEEVRTVLLAKLRLHADSRMLEIGGGTGSVTVEAGRLLCAGTVTVVEEDDTACSLIRENIQKFELSNVSLIPNGAPCDAAQGEYDRIFIGGSGGRLDALLPWCHDMLVPGGRLAATAITLETLDRVLVFCDEHGYAMSDTVQLSVTRCVPRGSVHMLQAENPVFIIHGEKK